MVWNIEACRKLVERVGTLEEKFRMVRLGSDILPMYTEPTFRYFWRQPDTIRYLESAFSDIGRIATSTDVRLSFHPGQFTVLASDDSNIVDRSIEEFEYHAYMAAAMGYGKTFQDFKINVHIAGRAGPKGIRAALKRLSPEARNCITIENEEVSYGIDDCLDLGRDVAIVLDVHHHWVRTGEYILATDDKVKHVESSWRGIRPVIHYSCSREDVLGYHDPLVMPDMFELLESGHKKQKLRAHSNFMGNKATNMYVSEFWSKFDIQVEAKAKNLASFALYEEIKNY